MAYIGREGYLVDAELREGKQHSQKHTPEFLRELIPLCRELTDEPLMFRMDSGNDAVENIGILLEHHCDFIIKHNLRKESPQEWLALAKRESENVTKPRDGKEVYIGSVDREISYTDAAGEKHTASVRIVYEITERSIDKKGQYLLPHDIEVNAFWTSLSFSDEDVIEHYHAHGESEQFHSEIKHDMDMERFPSGKFETNELFLELGMIAYNILRMIGQAINGGHDAPMKRKTRRRRIRTVILNIIHAPAHVTQHARRLRASLGKSNAWADTFMRVNASYQFSPA